MAHPENLRICRRRIYALVDPRDRRVRYVGCTAKPLADRLYGHVHGHTSLRLVAWLRELRAAGLLPRLRRLATVNGSLHEAEAVELAWIRRYPRSQLLNVRRRSFHSPEFA